MPQRSERGPGGRRSLEDFIREADTIVPLQASGKLMEGICQELSPANLRKLFAAFIVNPTFPITRYLRPEPYLGGYIQQTVGPGPGSASITLTAPRGKCVHIVHTKLGFQVSAAVDSYEFTALVYDESGVRQVLHIEQGNVVNGNSGIERLIPTNLWIPELHRLILTYSHTGAAAQARVNLSAVGYIWPSGVYPLA